MVSIVLSQWTAVSLVHVYLTLEIVKWIPQMTFSIKTETGFGTFLGFYLRLKKSCSWKHLWLPAFDYQLFLYVECNEIYEAVQAFLSHNWWFQQCLERKQCGGKKFFDLTYCS